MMSSSDLTTRTSKNRTALLVAVGLVLFYLGYFALLQRAENQASADYAQLRQGDAAHYLEEVEALRGFDAYFDEFAKMHDYSTPRDDVPPFLVGRWAMFDAPKQVQDSYIPEDCVNSLMIEDGRVKTFGDKAAQYDVQYSIAGDKVIAATQAGEQLKIDPVAYSSHIHHLVVNMPGTDGPVYAYLCK